MGEGDFVAALQPVHMLYKAPRFFISAPMALTDQSSNMSTTWSYLRAQCHILFGSSSVRAAGVGVGSNEG